jgi:nicotinate-nucleotide adenylyltransferase
MSKIGILGGTFNPIHNSHILLSEYCKNELNLDKIIIIPTYTPPHKDSQNLVSEQHRVNMCKLACEDLDNYEVSDIEILRKGKSYSYQTLTSLKEKYSGDELIFIMGADMFLTLDKWKHPEIIFSKASIAAIPRNQSDISELNSYYEQVLKPMGAKAYILPKSVIQVSSTFIRDNIDNLSVTSEFLNEKVYKYILKNNLYRK